MNIEIIKAALSFSHEYNEYVGGFVVTERKSGKTLNFQLNEIYSNHPSPDYDLFHSCQGDETHLDWTEEELEAAGRYLKSKEDVKEWLLEVNQAKDEKPDQFEEVIREFPMSKLAFFNLLND